MCHVELAYIFGLCHLYCSTGGEQKKAPSGKAPERADWKVIRTFSVRV